MSKPAEYLSKMSKAEVRATLVPNRQPVSIAICGSGNEFNIGGMIRTAHNFLVSGIHLIEVEWFYKKGACSTLPYEKDNIHRWPTLEEFLTATSSQPLIAFERREGLVSLDIRKFQYPTNPILFFGSEKTGVPDSALEQAHSIVSVPIVGLNNDHNVSVTCGICLYDWYVKATM